MTSNPDLQACVESADEDDDLISGNRARTPSAPASVKEEANVSRTRNTDMRRGHEGSRPTSPAADQLDSPESDAAVRTRRRREPTEAKDKDKQKTKRKSVTYVQEPRPATARSKTTPNLNINTTPSTSRRAPELAPSHIITAAATTSRPRAYTAQSAPRPASYYGSPVGPISRPPQSNARHLHLYGPPPLGSSYPPPSSPYAPHSPMYLSPATAPPYPGQYPPPFSPAPGFSHPPDYFGQGAPRPLNARPAVEYRRPTSATGHRAALTYINPNDYEHEDRGLPVRRSSIKKRSTTREQQQAEERKLMPPPGILRRPSTTGVARSAFAPPSRQKRISISSARSFDIDSDEESQDSTSEASHLDWQPHPVLRPSMNTYEVESRYERSPERRRRDSQYGTRAQSTERTHMDKMQDKLQDAERHQAKNGTSASLTAEKLRKINRTPSQRTKSTTSRGNESYTDDPMRILVKGAATLTIGGASMSVQDGAEIHIPANIGGGTSRGGGSNGSEVTYEEQRRLEDVRDRRSTRVDRPQARAGGRTTSRAGSRPRGMSQAPAYYAPTEYSDQNYHYSQAPAYAPLSGIQYPR